MPEEDASQFLGFGKREQPDITTIGSPLCIKPTSSPVYDGWEEVDKRQSLSMLASAI
jgi:hypothetical protein